MLITIVIPVYNEEKSISCTVENIEIYMSSKGIQHDVIIVDDGSVDNTVNVVNGIASKYPLVSFLKLGKNYGKGRAVREGMLKGKGDYILFMDAEITVFNISGRKIKIIPIRSKEICINNSEFSEGIYLFTLTDKKKRIFSTRVYL